MIGLIKKFLFRITPVQLVVGLVFIVFLAGFLALLGVTKAATGNGVWGVLFFLWVIFLLSRLSIIIKVGIGFLTFILFSVQMVFGPLVCFLMIFSSTAVYVFLATRQTPIDFAINKGVAIALAQTVYISIWVVVLVVFFKIFSVEYIFSHLTTTYLLAVFLYIVLMVVFLPVLAREPVPIVLVNGMMTFVFQFFVIKYLGPSFMGYLVSLG